MAIDTSLKRGSVIQVKLPFRMTLPFPTGTIGAAQRQAIVGAYTGIPAANPTPPPINNAIIVGLVMVDLGLTILLGGITTQLKKGLYEDPFNKLTR